jgi:hypothetical protein
MKIRNMIMAASLLAVGVTLFGVGCGDDSTSVTCSVKEAGATECSSISAKSGTNVTQDQLNAACPSPGKIVTSCPTAGLVGTCTYSDANFDYSLGFYSGTASVDEATCKVFPNGSWKAK